MKQASDYEQQQLQQGKHEEIPSSSISDGDPSISATTTSTDTTAFLATKYRRIVELIETEFPQIVIATSTKTTPTDIKSTTPSATLSNEEETSAQQQQQPAIIVGSSSTTPNITTPTTDSNNGNVKLIGNANNTNINIVNLPELYRAYHRDQFRDTVTLTSTSVVPNSNNNNNSMMIPKGNTNYRRQRWVKRDPFVPLSKKRKTMTNNNNKSTKHPKKRR